MVASFKLGKCVGCFVAVCFFNDDLVSIATALIPFLENDDTNRALMGSNMQRQAVPLLRPQAPMIATGVEHRIAYDSGVLKIAKNDGFVKYVDSNKIVIEETDGNETTYTLSKFERSNQSTCINQHPIVKKGDKVVGPKYDENGVLISEGTVLADGPRSRAGRPRAAPCISASVHRCQTVASNAFLLETDQ